VEVNLRDADYMAKSIPSEFAAIHQEYTQTEYKGGIKLVGLQPCINGHDGTSSLTLKIYSAVQSFNRVDGIVTVRRK